MARFTALDKRQRNPQTLQSNSFPVPASLPFRKFAVYVLLDAADLDDTTLFIRFAVQASFDATGANWIDLFSNTWQGGQLDGEGNPRPAPAQEWQTSGPLPFFVRGELDWNKRVSIGVDLETA